MKAHEVCSHLKAGTVVVSEDNDRVVILVIEYAGDTILVNPYNGVSAEYYEWFRIEEEVYLFEDLEEWIGYAQEKKKAEKENSS